MKQPGHLDVPLPDGRGLRVAVVVSRFNHDVTDRLRDGAREALVAAGVLEHAIEVVHVPGAFELPQAARALAVSGRVDAVVCLGCVIRGETPHFEYISSATAHGVMQASLDSGIPMAFGVLTTDTPEQAAARSAPGSDNKGYEAALAAIELARVVGRVQRPAASPGFRTGNAAAKSERPAPGPPGPAGPTAPGRQASGGPMRPARDRSDG